MIQDRHQHHLSVYQSTICEIFRALNILLLNGYKNTEKQGEMSEMSENMPGDLRQGTVPKPKIAPWPHLPCASHVPSAKITGLW